MNFLIKVSLFFLLISIVLAVTTVSNSPTDYKTQSKWVTTTTCDGQESINIYGRLLSYGVKITGTADPNDTNGCDVTIRDEWDKTIIYDPCTVDGTRRAFTIVDANGNPYGGIPVTGLVDVNWTGNNHTQTLYLILYYEVANK